MTLSWNEISAGILEAHGDDWTYVITQDDRQIVLTRWDAGILINAAAQAALNAISIGGAYKEVPEAARGVITHMKQAAQQYESGLDVTGYPAWWH